jgi:hypothetical protein
MIFSSMGEGQCGGVFASARSQNGSRSATPIRGRIDLSVSTPNISSALNKSGNDIQAILRDSTNVWGIKEYRMPKNNHHNKRVKVSRWIRSKQGTYLDQI